MAQEWWRPELHPKLSQGDIISLVPLGSVTNPVKYLQSAALRGGAVSGWAETLNWKPDHDGMGHILYRGRVSCAIVLSHDCEIDKPNKGTRVIVSPVIPLSDLREQERQRIVDQTPWRFLVLPGMPSLGDNYTDLRCTTFLPAAVAFEAKRIASMEEDARLRLQQQLIAFFTRIDASASLRGIGVEGPSKQ